MRITPAAAALALACALGAGFAVPTPAAAAPPSLPNRALDLELKAADIKNVFKLLAEVSQRKVVLDPCVNGRVDINLHNTPIPLVFDALALKLGLIYEEEDGAILVRCAGDGGSADAKLSARVSVAEQGAALPDVLEKVAHGAKLDGVDYRAAARPKVTITLQNVRLATTVAALSDETGLKIKVAGGKVVVE
jgi:type II secretory pathway component HofQ